MGIISNEKTNSKTSSQRIQSQLQPCEDEEPAAIATTTTTTIQKARQMQPQQQKSLLKHPKLFGLLVVLHFLLACGGFIPSIGTFLRKRKWYLNPIKQPEEWANEHHSTMKAHAYISLLWIFIAFLQYVVTPLLLPLNPSSNHTTTTTRTATVAKLFHKVIGYTASLLLVLFALNANLLTIKNGVSGLVLYNLLALITGTMMMWHLIRGIRYIVRYKAIRSHIHEMCGLLSWTCFPGVIRLVAIIPYQVFLYGGGGDNNNKDQSESCDVMNTSGMMAGTFPLMILGLALLKYAATHEPFRHKDYIHFYVLIGADVLIGLLGGTLFQCYPNGQPALLQQAPGKPWTLQRYHWQQQEHYNHTTNTSSSTLKEDSGLFDVSLHVLSGV